MIDVESLIFSQVAEALRVAFPGIFVSGEYVDTPAKFPAVTIVESDNTIVQRMRTANIENAATLMYEVNVYTNTVGYKKSEAKDIMEAVDGEFSKLGFARTMQSYFKPERRHDLQNGGKIHSHGRQGFVGLPCRLIQKRGNLLWQVPDFLLLE